MRACAYVNVPLHVCVCRDALARVFVCRLLWRHHLPSGLKVQGPHGGKANVTGQASQCQVPTNDVRRSPHCHCPNKQPCRPVRSPPDPSAPLSFACNDGDGDLGIKTYPGVALSDSPPGRKSAESLKTSIIYLLGLQRSFVGKALTALDYGYLWIVIAV